MKPGQDWMEGNRPFLPATWNLSLLRHVSLPVPSNETEGATVKKVNKPRREKIVVLEEKKLTAAKGSSGYMVSWGLDGAEDPTHPGDFNP